MEGPDLSPAHDQLFRWTYRQQKQRGFTAFLRYWLKAAFQILADCMQAWQCDSGRASMRGRERLDQGTAAGTNPVFHICSFI